jgi:two-component system, OmpR family, clock-associated histidine kinase SasA
MQSSSDPTFESAPDTYRNPGLQLMLFIDKRATSKEQSRQVKRYLDTFRAAHSFDLEVVDIEEQPYLVEHFRLIATPALVKIYPEPRHVLAGNNLVVQLKDCWPRWIEANLPKNNGTLAPTRSLSDEVQFMKLKDEIFRLQQENEAFQEQLRFKDRIIAMLAHDLRNPLTAVSIALETLENLWKQEIESQKESDPTLLSRLAHHARSQMNIIERMITNLLEASQQGDVRLELRPRKLDLSPLCNSVVADLRPQLEAKRQAITTDIPLDLPLVHADGDSIRQLFVNLLDNAIKYTPAHGEIQISILHRTTQKIQVSISDNGLGIPREKQKFIFQDTFRLDRDQHEKGYGLGLALCQRIVRAHYGQIWVDSTPDKGSCFHFTLPIYRF